ncbi:MAG: DNA-binding response regulator [Caldilineae bacterium]|nr:MAG: DNA-binding response regulator [Caldilineae bacterium]
MPDTPKRKRRILIAEDEAPLRNLIELSLKANDYEVINAVDGKEALERFKHEQPIDMVILDVMMPHVDGFTVLQKIREVSEVPVVMLTALGSGDDIVKGFQLGADDYITKPFTFREVAARIEAILRRVEWMNLPPPEPVILRRGDIEIDKELHTVKVRGEECHVTPIEFELLKYFMSHPDQVIGKEELFREVWGYEFEGSTNLVEVGVRRLRSKIERDPSHPEYIITVRGAGYLFRDPDSKPQS